MGTKGICLVSVLAIAMMAISGCSKKQDSPKQNTPAPAEPATQSVPADAEKEPATKALPVLPENARVRIADLNTILEFFNSDKKEQAAQVFLVTKWDRPKVFGADSVFGVSEADFAQLSESRRQQLQQEAMETTASIKELMRYLVDQAQQANADREKYRQALLAFGQRLSGDDQLAAIQQTGKAVIDYVEKELGNGN